MSTFMAATRPRGSPMTEQNTIGTGTTPSPERDSRLDRLLALADGVFAIALTLLAVELTLPEAAADLHGQALLTTLLGVWPKLLSYLTSFTMIAVFWQAHHRLFLQVRRFDGVLLWLVFLQLASIAFLPFPTAVVGAHVGDPVAEEFYFGSLLLISLDWSALRWYASAGYRLVSPELSPHDLRRYLRISLVAPVTFLILMGLIPVGLGELIEPLLRGYLVALFYVVFSIHDWWPSQPTGSEATEKARPESAQTEERQESEGGHTNG
jgi:uncharacterized membrane protein